MKQMAEEKSFVSKIGTSVMNAATSTLSSPASWLMEFVNGGSKSSSGITINLSTALSIPEVLYGTSKISGAIAGMPLLARKYDDRGFGQLVTDDAGAYVWANPNNAMTNFQMVESLLVHALLLGNGRLLIERDKFGRPVGLIPLSPYSTQTIMVDGEKYHYVSGIDDYSSMLEKDYESKMSYTFKDEDVIHIMNLSLNGGIWGVNILDLQRDNFGLSIAGMEAQGVTYKHSGRPNMVLTAPRGVFRDKDEAQTFMDNFRKDTSSLDNRGRAALIREGMGIESMSTATETEATDSRQFQRESAALVLMLEQIIGDGSSGVYGSLAEKHSAWLSHGLGRWLNKIEQEARIKLLSESMRRAGMYYDFDVASLHKVDKEGMLNYTQGLRTQGVVSSNEVRLMHNLPPIDDPAMDQDFYAGLNTVSMDSETPEEEESQDVPADEPEITPEDEN